MEPRGPRIKGHTFTIEEQSEMASIQFPNLFSPLTMRNVTIRNRIVSTAHATVLADNGMPGPKINAYQAEKARGGAGLIICYGSASVHHSSPAVDWGGVELFEDKVIPVPEGRFCGGAPARGEDFFADYAQGSAG